MSRALFALVALPLLLAAPIPAAADDDHHDHDDARAAVESGAALPLETILSRVKGNLPGEIVKVKLEREHGNWIYEFRVVDPQGRRHEVNVNAATGDIMAADKD